MRLSVTQAAIAIAIGLGATLFMDVWNTFLFRAFGIPSLSYCLLGRWLRHIPSGTIRHPSIAAARSLPYECSVGWVAHYTIGVVFALIFVSIARGGWLARPTLLPALFFGFVTVVFPFFIMQPSLGLGVASSKARKPMQARLKSVLTHTIFGVGLYICAIAASWILRVGA